MLQLGKNFSHFCTPFLHSIFVNFETLQKEVPVFEVGPTLRPALGI